MRTQVLLVVLSLCLLEIGLASRRITPRGGRNLSQRVYRKSLSNRNYGSHRRDSRAITPQGIDFSLAEFDEETGKRCVIKEETVQSIEKEPILECTHREVEKCHYSYVTQFTPAQEEVCEENFEKKCQITFKQQAINETVRKCYRPTQKVCDGTGEDVCQTVYESSCTTRYVEKQPGKFVGDTSCEKLPVEICGAGCVFEEGPEECHDKVIASLVDVPEEICDLNPQKTCKFQTKLVPKLTPKHQCTLIPQEVCNLRYNSPRPVTKPLITKWCLDDSPVVPGESYDESNALGDPLTESFRSQLGNSVDLNLDPRVNDLDAINLNVRNPVAIIPFDEDEVTQTVANPISIIPFDEDEIEDAELSALELSELTKLAASEPGSGELGRDQLVVIGSKEVSSSNVKDKTSFATQQFEDFVDFSNF